MWLDQADRDQTQVSPSQGKAPSVVPHDSPREGTQAGRGFLHRESGRERAEGSEVHPDQWREGHSLEIKEPVCTKCFPILGLQDSESSESSYHGKPYAGAQRGQSPGS